MFDICETHLFPKKTPETKNNPIYFEVNQGMPTNHRPPFVVIGIAFYSILALSSQGFMGVV